MATNCKRATVWTIASAAAATLWCLSTTVTVAQQESAPAGDVKPLDLTLLDQRGILHTYVGVTRSGTPIDAFITEDDLNVHTKKFRLLIVAGLDGSAHTPRAAVNVMRQFYVDDRYALLRERLALSVVPTGNPDGLARGLRDDNAAGGNPARGYPPPENAYLSTDNPEAQYLWRWIGMHAPDHVVELIEGTSNKFVFASQRPRDSLARQLAEVPACQVGLIEGSCWSVQPGSLEPFADVVDDLIKDVTNEQPPAPPDTSAARRELQARDKRSPLDVCQQLSRVYGRELPTVAYIPAVACMARLRFARLTGDQQAIDDIRQISAAYTSGAKAALSEKSSGSELAGNILWGELYEVNQDRKLIELTLAAADRAFTEDGQPREAMPTHNEMSDAVFMGCPVLARAGRLTGQSKYFDMCLRHMRFMLKLNLRSDGLHRHSPLDETAWGRGNGFPALGLTLALADMPADYAGRDEMLSALRAHLTALLPHQDVHGAWHQVIDHPESYREFTATCMITYAMTHCVRAGWIEREELEPAIRRGWKAIKARTAADGTLVDVCASTGKMKSLREYFDRPALLGRDPRGGAMALLVATEIAAWEAETSK